jgi:hypothetical protein
LPIGLVLVICTTEFSVSLKICGNVIASEVDIDSDNELLLTTLLELSFDCWAIASDKFMPKHIEVVKMAIATIQL